VGAANQNKSERLASIFGVRCTCLAPKLLKLASSPLPSMHALLPRPRASRRRRSPVQDEHVKRAKSGTSPAKHASAGDSETKKAGWGRAARLRFPSEEKKREICAKVANELVEELVRLKVPLGPVFDWRATKHVPK
jgi:hypothetical protein